MILCYNYFDHPLSPMSIGPSCCRSCPTTHGTSGLWLAIQVSHANRASRSCFGSGHRSRHSQSCSGQLTYCLFLEPLGKTKTLHSDRGVGMGTKSSALERISFKKLRKCSMDSKVQIRRAVIAGWASRSSLFRLELDSPSGLTTHWILNPQMRIEDELHSCCSTGQGRLEHIHDSEGNWLLPFEADHCTTMECRRDRHSYMLKGTFMLRAQRSSRDFLGSGPPKS